VAWQFPTNFCTGRPSKKAACLHYKRTTGLLRGQSKSDIIVALLFETGIVLSPCSYTGDVLNLSQRLRIEYLVITIVRDSSKIVNPYYITCALFAATMVVFFDRAMLKHTFSAVPN
jgi:hypothetical protein